MPITANAKKALRQQKARGVRNKNTRAQVRTIIKKTAKQPEAGILSQLFSTVDKAVKKHILHKNKAARIKAQAAKAIASPAADQKPASAKKSSKTTAKKTTKKSTKKAAVKTK